MNLGYLLAIVESLLLVTGALVGLIRFIRKPTAESFLLLGLLFAFVAAIVILSLRVPSYAQINAFYALPALLSLSPLAAIGYDFFARRSAVLSVLLRAGIFAWVITVFASFWIRPGNPLNHTTRALALGDSGKIGQAAKEYSRALKLAPASLLGRTRFSDFLSRTGHLDEARRQAAQAFQLYPGQPEALAQAGISLEFLGRYEDALEVLPQALAKAPDHMLAYASLANSLIQLEQNKRAIAVCEQGLGVDPFNYELHYLIAAAAAEAGDFTNAASHLQFALDLEPDWAQARWLLASVMRASGRSAEAGANYQKLLQSNPNDAKAHFLLAETLRAQGDLRGALDQYRQVLALEPDRVEALNNLAWILATTSKNELRNAKEAVRFAESADKLTDSHQPVVLVTLSVAYAEAGRFGEAVATVEKARQLAGSSGNNELAEKSSQLMELFKAGKPFREAEPLN
jgi:tetratricopeptide (TPR) repeat protein